MEAELKHEVRLHRADVKAFSHQIQKLEAIVPMAAGTSASCGFFGRFDDDSQTALKKLSQKSRKMHFDAIPDGLTEQELREIIVRQQLAIGVYEQLKPEKH